MAASQPANFNLQEFTDAGALLAGGRLYTFAYGTTIQKTAFTDPDGTIPYTYTPDGVGGQYIALNARGELPGPLYLGAGSYDISLKRADGSTVWTRKADGVDNSYLSLIAALASSLGGSMVGFIQSGVGAIVRWIVDKLRETVSVKDFAAISDGVTDDAAAVVKANSAAGRRPLVFIGVTHIGSPTTITAPIADTMEQIFTVTSQVTIDNGRPVRPEWWGSGNGTVDLAIKALPATGGVVRLESARYKDNSYDYGFGGTGKYIAKDNVTIRGRKMPRLNSNCTALDGGTVIEGMVSAWANNIEFRDLGVDCGYNFINTVRGGADTAGYSDGLTLTYPNNAIKDAAGVKVNARLHNVIGLCYGPASPNHGILIEGYKNVRCTGEVIGCYGVHGVAIKAKSVSADRIKAYCNNSDGVVIKSDVQASAMAEDVQIGEILADGAGPAGLSPYALPTAGTGLLFYAAGHNISRVQIGRAFLLGYPKALDTSFSANETIDNIQIGELTTDQAGVGGAGAAVSLISDFGEIPRFHIGSAILRNCGTGLLASFLNPSGSNQVSVGRLEVVNSSDVAVYGASAAAVTVGHLVANNCFQGVYRLLGSARVLVGALSQVGGTPRTYTSTSSGEVPALGAGWTNLGSGNPPFRLELRGGGVRLTGLIKPGDSTTAATIPQWARPATPKRFMCQGYNGSATTAVPVTLGTDGNLNVNEVAGGTANCSSWLSLDGIVYDLDT